MIQPVFPNAEDAAEQVAFVLALLKSTTGTCCAPSRPRVLNKRFSGIPLGAVYVGRPTKWGNPFPVGDFPDRESCLAAYRAWLESQPELIQDARRELAGKDLVCFCAPKPCHGDVLIQVANAGRGAVDSGLVTAGIVEHAGGNRWRLVDRDKAEQWLRQLAESAEGGE
jgi:hypothetical protein